MVRWRDLVFEKLCRGAVFWKRLETTSACRVWTVFSANQSTESRCHCSATNSCQNLPRRVGEIINSISSAGPHFTGGGPPHGVPWSRMKCKWCGFWMCGGAAPAPTELMYIVSGRTEFTIIGGPALLSFCVSFLPFFISLCFSVSFFFFVYRISFGSFPL